MGPIPFKNRTGDDENFEKHPFLPNFTSGGTFRQQPDSKFIFARTGCVAPGGKCNDETTYVRCLKILNVWMPVQLDFCGGLANLGI